MLTQSESHPVQQTRKQVVEAINHAMARFPLILETLTELSKAPIPLPGDEDIRHGCERALTAMLVELARMKPAPPSGKPGMIEVTALHWIHSKAASHLINADQLQRIEQFIQRILGTADCHHH